MYLMRIDLARIALSLCLIQIAPSYGMPPERLDNPYLPAVDGPTPHGPSNAPLGSVQVNVDSSGLNIVGDAANEPSIVIDPTNPLHMAIGWRQFDTVVSNFRQAGYAYSADGGDTWTFPGVLQPGVFRSDPVLDADSAGRFFYSSLQSSFCVDMYRSTNGGATWPESFPAAGGDKQWMAVDRSGGIGDGNLYQAWQVAFPCSGTGIFTRSTDHGVTWSSPIDIPNNPVLGVVAVGPDGAVYVAGTTSLFSSTFVVAKSTNARNAGEAPSWDLVAAGEFLGGQFPGGGAPNPGGLSSQIWVAVNPTNSQHVFLLGSIDPPGPDPLDVRFARSLDGGQTWEPSVRINDDSSENNAYQWFGTMSVAPNGRIDVIWNDTREDPNHVLSRVEYSYSTDEGATWATNVALTPQWNSTIGWPNQQKIGDYYHMISANAAAHLAYAATFNVEQDVYYTRIVHCNSCPGDLNGDGLRDGRDIAIFTRCMQNLSPIPVDCGCSDMNGDSQRDLFDLPFFVIKLLTESACP